MTRAAAGRWKKFAPPCRETDPTVAAAAPAPGRVAEIRVAIASVLSGNTYPWLWGLCSGSSSCRVNCKKHHLT